MDDNELGKWLREELRQLNVASTLPREARAMEIDSEAADALTALLALLGEVEGVLTRIDGPALDAVRLLARLRLVLGERR